MYKRITPKQPWAGSMLSGIYSSYFSLPADLVDFYFSQVQYGKLNSDWLSDIIFSCLRSRLFIRRNDNTKLLTGKNEIENKKFQGCLVNFHIISERALIYHEFI